jgi:glycerate-2-kinase
MPEEATRDEARVMIKNRDQLLSHGCIEGRRLAADIIDAALRQVDPYTATKNAVRCDDKDGLLRAHGDIFDLNDVENLYVVGAGKATFPIARALDEILGERIRDGLVVVKEGQSEPLSHIRVSEADHPIPDQRSAEACQEVFKIVDRAGPGDLVITIVTGGSSALCSHPVPGITFDEKRTVHDLLLRCGAEIREINTVRKHLSAIKGGRLTERILPATIVSLCVSDVIHDPLEWNTDWTAPDSSTLADAADVLGRYGLWDVVPESVHDYLSKPAPEKETPKAFPEAPLHFYMVLKTRTLCEAAVARAEELGLLPVLVTTSLNGESREAGRTLAAIAKEVHLSGNPVKAPCALIAGGETTVRIEGHTIGEGGPNQELALGGCLDLEEDDPIVMCAVDSDGRDGSSAVAGAMTDGSTRARARRNGFDCFKTLMDHNTSALLNTLDDDVITGPTGTNVNDLAVCIVLPPA